MDSSGQHAIEYVLGSYYLWEPVPVHKCAHEIFITKGTDEGSRRKSLDCGVELGEGCVDCSFALSPALCHLARYQLALWHLAH